ncbi:hypothetical protein EBB07_20565 [Paenibacillaceae bacterium]|nr:hypothetical protein EBB07_20565 [Paenibacillaceae bacterium]
MNRRHLQVMLCLLLLASAMLVATACSGQKDTPGISTVQHVDAVEPAAEESGLIVEMIKPDQLRAGKPFKLVAELVNTSAAAQEIQHGADMFTYQIFDANGGLVMEEVSMRMRDDIGFMRTLKPGSRYTTDGEGHVSPPLDTRTIDKSGNYTIIATAEFRVTHEGANAKQVKLVSEPIEVVVE